MSERTCDDCKKPMAEGENRKRCQTCKKQCCPRCLLNHNTPPAKQRSR